MSRWVGVLAAFVGLVQASSGVAQPSAVAASSFVSGAGFGALDAAGLTARFPIVAGAVTPVEIAALLLDEREAKTVWRSRILVRLERRMVAGDTLDLIEIERYNLGPAVRQEALRTSGKVAALEAFGSGPHVAWRIATRPDGPGRNVLVAAGRRDYLEFEARERDCLGALCTSVQALLDKRGTWTTTATKDGAPIPAPYPAVVTHTDGQVDFEDETVAHAVRALAVRGGLASGEAAPMWTGPGPGVTTRMRIDANAGEDAGADMVVGPDPDARWVRRTVTVNPGPVFTEMMYSGIVRLR